MAFEFLTLVVAFFLLNNSLLLFSVAFPKRLHSSRTSRKKPTFTVIIANADSGNVLTKTLSSIRNADYPQKKVEIIVVDSTGTKAVAASSRRHKARLIKDTAASGKGAALNIGIRKARNEILYFLDSDTFIERNALENIAKSISKETPAVQGIFTPINKSGLSSLMARMEIILSNVYNFWCFKFLKTSIAGGRNFSIYKDQLLKIGGFESTLAEDANLSRRLYEKKVKVLFNHRIVSKELVPVNLAHIWKQHERWYSGSFREIISARSSSFIILPFLIATAFFYAFLPVLGLIFISSGNIFALIGMSMGFMVVLHQASRQLTTTEIILSPVIVVLLSIFSVVMLFNIVAKMVLGIRIGWYKTPKAM